MKRAIGEVFDYNGVTLVTIENNGCKGCFFNNNTCAISSKKAEIGFCSAGYRNDNKNVIFKEMETRSIKLTLEKAKEFYKKGGEFKDLALSAFTEEELTKVELPKTWEEFCKNYEIQKNECYINSNSTIKPATLSRDLRLICTDSNLLPDKQAAEAHLALMQLHQLRDCYRQGWKPDWEKEEVKWCIDKRKNYLIITSSYSYSKFLSFQSKEIAELFLDNFQDLIKQAGDLI